MTILEEDMVYEAIQASIAAHKGQLRKLEDGVYVAHPLEVAIILAQNGADESTIAAGVLHDTIEDTTMNTDQLQAQFGDEIATIVAGCTEPDKRASWQTRKEWAIDHLRQKATRKMRMVICADKLSNIRSIERNLKVAGKGVWDQFHAPYQRQKWYYQSMLEGLSDLADLAMYQELSAAIARVFND